MVPLSRPCSGSDASLLGVGVGGDAGVRDDGGSNSGGVGEGRESEDEEEEEDGRETEDDEQGIIILLYLHLWHYGNKNTCILRCMYTCIPPPPPSQMYQP